jgi:hypothetical protein
MSDFVGEAVSERVSGGRPSWLRAAGAAILIGGGAALLAYRLLRGEPSGNAVPGAGD